MTPKTVINKGLTTNLENEIDNNNFESNIQVGDQNTENVETNEINEEIQEQRIVLEHVVFEQGN